MRKRLWQVGLSAIVLLIVIAAAPAPGTLVPARGTFSIREIGKPGTPRLTPSQLAWVRRIETSRRYRDFAKDLRFTMVPSPLPLTVYDACGGGWGEPRNCGSPARLDEAAWNKTYHVIGASCHILLMVAGLPRFTNSGPQVFAGRDPSCDVLPGDIEARENLDWAYRVCEQIKVDAYIKCLAGSQH